MAGMRSLLAALALLLATLTGTAALVAYMAHESILDPDRSGEMLSAALKEPELREELLTRALPDYQTLPQQYRDAVDRTAQSPAVDRALKRLEVDRDGNVHLGPARAQLAERLRAAGQQQLATRVEQTRTRDSVRLPQKVTRPYTDAGDSAWLVATRGAAVAAGLLLVALVVSRHRHRALAAAGVALLVVCGLAALAYSMLPRVAGVVTDEPWIAAAADAGLHYPPSVTSVMIALAVAGGALLVVSAALPRRTTRRG